MKVTYYSCVLPTGRTLRISGSDPRAVRGDRLLEELALAGELIDVELIDVDGTTVEAVGPMVANYEAALRQMKALTDAEREELHARGEEIYARLGAWIPSYAVYDR